MAQLPPKPTITQNWPSFPHQRMSSNFMSNTTNTTGTGTATATATGATTSQQHQQQLPPWVDEFLDFSSARRGSHHRSASDSIAFLDTPFLLDDIRSSDEGAAMAETAAHGFDVLDVDDQFIAIFSDDIALPTPSATAGSPFNPSSPSDQNSNNDKATALDGMVPMQGHDQHPKNEACEVESSCRSDAAATAPPFATPRSTATIGDPKRVKRILANRQSAQRSRVRKLQYISELERSVTSLQTEVSALSPRVAFLDHQRLILNVDNSTLKQRIAAMAQDKIFKDAHQQALKKEIERLRQIYHQQKMGKLVHNNGQSLHSPRPSQPQPPMPPHSASSANSISALGM